MIFSETSIINGVSIAVCWLLIISVSFIGLKWLIKEDSEKSGDNKKDEDIKNS